jgi:hypothetical protein
MDSRSVYVRLLNIVDYFVSHAAHLRVEELKGFDPSIEELEREIKKLSGIIGALASSSYEDENMAINALQCCFEMERLAHAVRQQDDTVLEEIFRKLEMQSKAP